MLSIAPTFGLATPATLEEALALLSGARPGAARLVAGGTDLLPNLKQGLLAPDLLISLARVPGLRQVVAGDDMLELGALLTLDALAAHPELRSIVPALTDAAAQIAGPQQRRMGTLGGNVLLDTRCIYYNQSPFWRAALGYCLKKDGDTCHVVPGGRRCVAAQSNDTAPALLALGAELDVIGPGGRRRLAMASLYVNDGAHNHTLADDEILTTVRIPRPHPHRRVAFEKLRVRDAIDFPLLHLALGFDLQGTPPDASLQAPVLIVGALAARPRVIPGLPEGPLDRALMDAFADQAFRVVRPLANIDGDLSWRRSMVRILVERAFDRALRLSGTLDYK